MTCSTLTQLLSQAPEVEMSVLDAHINGCSTCAEQFAHDEAVMAALHSQPVGDHLTSEQVWTLASTPSDVPEGYYPLWRHVVKCRTCSDEVLLIREALSEPSAEVPPLVPSKTVWEAWQKELVAEQSRVAVLVVSWAASRVLQYRSHHNLRRTTMCLKAAIVSSIALDIFAADFPPYTLSIRISPEDESQERTSCLDINLTCSEDAQDQPATLAIRYEQEPAEVIQRGLGTKELCGLRPGKYELLLTTEHDSIGSLRLEIQPR